MRYQQTCTSCSGPILFGFLTENIFIFPLIYWGSWFNAVRIIFFPIINHFWVAVSRYYIFRSACVASWNNTCFSFGLYYLCYSFSNSAVISFIIVIPLDSYYIYWMHWGTEWFHMVHFSRWFEMDRTSYMSKKAEFLKDVLQYSDSSISICFICCVLVSRPLCLRRYPCLIFHWRLLVL